jgi:cell wall-associated NlpC family hydrolase
LGTSLNIFTSGCSATSKIERYKQKEIEIQQLDTNVVRFTAQEDTTSHKFEPDEQPEFDEIPSEDIKIDEQKFAEEFANLEQSNIPHSTKEEILLEIIKYLKTPYKYGGKSTAGMDCSGFTSSVYMNSINLALPRTAREQFQIGEKIVKDSLLFGDLVFFNTSRKVKPGHVGIYIGDNKFAHASRTNGVGITSLEEKYYKKRYMGAKRINQFED